MLNEDLCIFFNLFWKQKEGFGGGFYSMSVESLLSTL